MMLKFGDPEWYDTYVVPVRDAWNLAVGDHILMIILCDGALQYGKKIWPEFEKTHVGRVASPLGGSRSR